MSISFGKMNEEHNNLLIVDALNLAFRWKHIGATDFYEDYLRTIDSFKKSYKAKYVIIATDQGDSWYRKAIDPLYKANREEKFATQTEAENQAFLEFMADYRLSLDHLRNTTKYPVIQYRETEADDIAAYIVDKVSSYNIGHTWLLSTDKDWDLLLRDDVSRFSYVTRKEISINNWDSTHDYLHEDHLSIKCLMGDSGDNVPGIVGIGPKRAVTLVKQYGSALDIFDSLPLQSNLKFIKALNESGNRIMLNYRLMDLITFCADALGDNTEDIDRILKEYLGNE